ncbi:MAG: hypothetical protein U0231_11035 [Nitrospiraceae bacterium]
MAEEVTGESLFELGVYPKAQILNRFIAKVIDLLIVAAADRVVPPVGFLAGLAYILVADGFAGGRSLGKRLIGLQTVVPRTRDAAGFKESIIRISCLVLPSWYRNSHVSGSGGWPFSRSRRCL